MLTLQEIVHKVQSEVIEAQKNKSEREKYLEKFLKDTGHVKYLNTPQVISYTITILGKDWDLEYYPYHDSFQITFPNQGGCKLIKFSEGLPSTFEECLRSHLINSQ